MADTSNRHSARPPLARSAQRALRRGAAQPRRRHQVQRPGKDQRHRIFDFGRLDPRRRRPQPRPLRPADDDQAQGQGRALFREPGSKDEARRRRRVRRIRRVRAPALAPFPERPAAERHAPPASARCASPAPPRHSRGSRPSRPAFRPATFSPSHAPASLPNHRSNSSERVWRIRRAGGGECSQPQAWDFAPTLGWENPPMQRPTMRFFAVFRDWHAP